ncbi:hypothetical protein JW721_02615 [Candidatus Micrarchaeota archaeon]|nr:hypothetical protein [Candidatus Micrarchaeota archaeon]
MAMRQKEKEGSAKLSLTPSIEPSYVQKQLQEAVRTEGGPAIEIPEELINAVSKTRSPAKLAEVSEALAKIAESAGKYSKEALAALASAEIAQAFATEPEKVAEAFLRIREAAGKNAGYAFAALGEKEIALAFSPNMETITDAFVALGRTTKAALGGAFRELSTDSGLRTLLAKKPESFIRIAHAAGTAMDTAILLLTRNGYAPILEGKSEETTDAFVRIAQEAGNSASAYFFGMQDFAGLFAKSPKRFTETYLEAASICGRKKSAFFGFLSNKTVSGAVSADSSKLLKIAEALSYSTLLLGMEEAGEKDKEKILKRLDMLNEPENIAREYGIPRLAGYRGKWRQGKKLARKAGVTSEDREVFINFAYAKDTIGAQKTGAIYKEYGIEYFARYTKEELESLYAHIGEKGDPRPLMLVAGNKGDQTGAFYREADTRAPVIAAESYNAIFFEAETEQEFYEFTRKFADKYFGISVLVIGGHGSADSIRLGPGSREENLLDLSDLDELRNLYGLFAEGAIVILDSCSTGEGKKAIGPKVSEAWEVLLLSPEVPAYIREFVMDDMGLITDAAYNEGGKRFYKGEELPAGR